MSIFIGFLTFILVLVALFLILLVLVQLPKKDAGVGMAFGAGMSEMILGAGSGNVLTRVTKYTIGIFLTLSLMLSVLLSSHARKANLGVSRALDEQARSAPAATAAPVSTLPTNPGLQPLSLPTAEPGNPLVSTTLVVQPTTPADPVPADSNPATPIPPAVPTPEGQN
jgi:preprotein translocase subunit SecG